MELILNNKGPGNSSANFPRDIYMKEVSIQFCLILIKIWLMILLEKQDNYLLCLFFKNIWSKNFPKKPPEEKVFKASFGILHPY